MYGSCWLSVFFYGALELTLLACEQALHLGGYRESRRARGTQEKTVVFPFVRAKYKWTFIRDRCKLSFPRSLEASPLARVSPDSLRSPKQESLLAGYNVIDFLPYVFTASGFLFNWPCSSYCVCIVYNERVITLFTSTLSEVWCWSSKRLPPSTLASVSFVKLSGDCKGLRVAKSNCS